MFTALDSGYSDNDMKLSLVRFVAELLIKTAHLPNNYLDETVSLGSKEDG
jgi:hypothetical protein